MMFPATFVLHQSAAAMIRVCPPDLVTVEGPALGPFRFRRAQLQRCSAVLVRVYRERHDAAFAAPNAEDIVILFQLGDSPQEILGPFPHREGIAIADALAIVRRDVLFASPTFSVTVAPECVALTIATRDSMGAMSVPVPTSSLVDLVVRDAAPSTVRCHVPTGLPPSGTARWIELAFLRDRPWSLGPLSADAAAVLVNAFRSWRTENPIDEQPVVVDAEALAAAPAAWHGRRIDVTARWDYAFERSGFVGAWLRATEHAPVTYGTYRARVVGTWIYPLAGADGGHGHMGCWPGELRAEAIEVLEVHEGPRVSRDGLTGLPTRGAIGAAFAQAHRPVALAVLDIDWLKRINDTHGYTVGDEVIRGCATATRETLRGEDVVVRWGGEELAVLLPGATLETARELLERVLERVRDLAIAAGGQRVGVTISAGVVEIAPGESFATAFERADRGLYEAKRAGRARVMPGPVVH